MTNEHEANARAKMITEALNARARLDKAAVEPVPVDAVEWIVEAYPVHDANEAKQFLADTVDATENFSGTMYWVRDSENRAVAITGCGAKGKQNAERIASLPARRGVSEWRTIDSAPRDGTKIIGYYRDQYGDAMNSCFWNENRWSYFLSRQQPTHWMPLPPAPSEAV